MTPDSRTVPVEGNRPDIGTLLSHREHLEAVYGSLPDGVTVQAADGRLVYANAAAVHALGFATLDEILAVPPQDAERWQLVDEKGRPFPPADLPGRRALEGGAAPERLVGIRIAGRADTRWSLVKASPVRDAAGRVTHAINVFRDVTAERESQERQRFLAEASTILSESLEVDATLATLTRLSVPFLGDWCAVDLLSSDGRIEQLAVAHVDPAKVRLGEEIARRYPATLDSPRAVATAMRTRRSILESEVTQESLQASASDAEHLRLLQETEVRSAMVVPLVARGRVLGAMTFCVSGANPRRYGAGDLAFAEDLAARAAVALDNARLFREAEGTRARLDEIVHGVEGILWEADAETFAFTFVSQRAESILGYPVKSWTDVHGFWADHIHPLDRTWAVDFCSTQTRQAKDHEFEYRMIAADGRVVWLRDTVFVVTDDEGRPRHLRGLMVDITERKQTEARLRTQNAISLHLATAESLASVAPALLEAIGTNLGWELGALWRHAATGDALECVAAWSPPGVEAGAFTEQTLTTRLRKGEGLPGEVWATNRAVWISDFAEETRFPRVASARAAGLHAAIGIPVWAGSHFHGVLEFFSRENRPADDALIAFIEGLGAQVGQFVERQSAEAAVKDSNARRGAVLETALDCIVSIDHRGTVLEWNASAERTFGYTREEAIGQEMAKLIVPPEYRETHRRGMAHYNRTGEGPVLGRRIEITAMRKDGCIFPVELAILPTKRANGPPIFVGHIRDITERKRAEAELESVKHNLELILNSVGEGVYGVDAEGNTTFMNDAALKMTGLTREEAIGRKLHGVIHHSKPDGSPYPAPECHIYKAAHGGPAARCTDEVFFTKDGKPFAVEYVTEPIVENGKVVGAVTSFTDVTARRAAEAALRESDQRFHLVTRATNDTIWDWDLRAGTLWWNENLHTTFGHALHEVEPGLESWTNRIHPEDLERVSRSIHHAIDGDADTWSDEYRFRCKDGRYAIVLDRGFISRDASGKAVRMVGSMTDVTKERQSAAALHERNRTLATLNRVNTVLAGELDLDRVLQQVTDAATEVAGAKFGAFFYNALNEKGETYLLYTRSGAPREAFDRFGNPRATALFAPTFRGEGIIRVDDVTKDPRYGQSAPHHGMPNGHLPVKSYLAVPVTSRSGEVIGGLFLGHPEPSVFTESSEQLVAGIAAQAAIAVDNANLYRKLQEELAERRRSEAALRDSEERFRRAFSDASIGMLVTGVDGTLEQANRAFAQMLGYTVEEVTARPFSELTHPDDNSRSVEVVQRMLRGESSSAAFEKRYLHRSGASVWAHVTTSLVRNAAGEPLHFVTQVQDITERKRAEAALRESEARYRLLAENSKDLITRSDIDGRLSYVSPASMDLLGYAPEELIGRVARELVHPDDLAYVTSTRERLHREVASQTLTMRYRHKQGHYVHVEVVARPVLDAKTGTPAEIVATWRDVTDRKQAEEALRHSEERFRSLSASSPIGIFMADMEGNATYTNPSCQAIGGFSEEEAVGKGWLTFVHPDDAARVAETWQAYATSGRPYDEEFRWLHRDGTVRWSHVRAAPVFDDRGVHMAHVGTVEDITERLQAQEELRRTSEKTNSILESISDAFFALDSDWRFSYVNRTAETILGRAQADLLGKSIWEEFPDAIGTPFEANYRKAMATQVPTQFEAWYDGLQSWYDVRAYPGSEGLSVYFQNVTERKRAEIEIAESRERLDIALGAADMGAWDLDLTKDEAIRSLRHDQIFGYPAEQPQWSSEIFFSHILPEHREQVKSAFDLAIRDGRLSFECEIRRADGELAWITAQGRVLYENGRAVRMLGVVSDITERRRMEEALQKERQLLTAILQQLPAGVIVVEAPTGRLLLANEAFNRILGHEPIDAQGIEQYAQYTPYSPDGRRLEVPEYPLIRALLDGEVVEGEELLYERTDKTRISLLVNAAPVRGTDGSIVAAVAGFIDITDRKRAELDLRYQRDLTKTITDNTGSALFMMDTKGHPIFMNTAAMAMTGYASLDEIRDQPLHYAVHFRKPDGSPYPMEECPIDQANAEIRPLKDQREIFCRKDGTLFPVEFNVAPIERGGEKLGAVLEVRDITEQLRAEEQLKARAEELAKLTDALQRSNRELDQFAYVTSHDLKAPLRGIANLSRWIEEDLGEKLTDDSREHLDLLRGRVHRMESLIEAILEYSRVGRVRGKPESIDTRELVDDVVDLLSPPEGFEVNVEGPMPTLVTERMRLQQVFLNLIGNAIKHHHAKDRGHITVTSEDLGSEYRFSVSDDGPGISPRFHEKIFVIFQTLEPRDKVEGTGIGLALVKKIVESEGGTVAVESAEGQGATFRFTWPKTA